MSIGWLKKLRFEIRVLKGKAAKNRTYSSRKTFQTREEALKEFERSRVKLFHIHKWSELPGISSSFTLYRGGKRIDRQMPEVNDYIRIILPGPVPANWVIVKEIRNEDESAQFTVSPTTDPTKKGGAGTEHFFKDEATSTFRVELQGKSIIGYELGRNERINRNSKKDAGNRKLINTIIAEGGWAGMQKLQWKKLTDYLVHNIEI
jgi:hypothetical protein